MRWLLVLVLACAKQQAVTGPNNLVKADIERAEQAEAQRKHDEARKHYEAAIAHAGDPKSEAFARREFAETLATWGEIENAVGELERAVKLDERDPIAWQMLGILRANAAINDTRGAFVALLKSKELAPRAWIPRRDLAVLYWKLGDRSSALAEYRAMLELDLPDRLREKVKWAIEELTRTGPPRLVPARSQPPSGPAPAPSS